MNAVRRFVAPVFDLIVGPAEEPPVERDVSHLVEIRDDLRTRMEDALMLNDVNLAMACAQQSRRIRRAIAEIRRGEKVERILLDVPRIMPRAK